MIIDATSLAPTAEQTTDRGWLIPSKMALVILLCVCAVSLLVNLDVYPRLWFDEGYKLNAAYTVVNDGLYASYTVDGYVPFDPGTSGGPADILPAALAIKLFGTTIFAARLTSVLYTLLAAVSLYSIGRYLWDAKAALFCVLLVIAIPPIENVSFILLGRQSLSEATAFSLMVCGIWLLTKGWNAPKPALGLSVASGVIMGLGMLSKTQIAISLVPALLTVAAWRWRRERNGFASLFAPAVTIVIIFLGWSLLGYLLTTPEIRQQNSALLMDAIRTNLITDLLGSNLDNQSLLVVGVILIGSLTNLVRIFTTDAFTPKRWIELLLIFFCVYLSIWFVVFSVGWPRYAFAGLVIGLLLLSRSVWQLIKQFFQSKPAVVVLFSLLVCATVGVNVASSFVYAVDDDVQQTAAYIASSIPPDAVIETWEWELDMLSQHRAYHHPPQAFLFEAIRQNSRNQSFAFNYDPLQSKPDYLIIGVFGSWTGIYSAELVAEHFTPVAQFGVYEVYKRKAED